MAIFIGRWAGIDYGTTRIGLALSDTRARIASPAGTVPGSGSPTRDAEQVARWTADNHAERVVVGLPVHMDGAEGHQARLTRQFATQLERITGRPVELWDERLSSFEADSVLDSMNASRQQRRKRRDALAAQVILQSFLDAHNPPPPDITTYDPT